MRLSILFSLGTVFVLVACSSAESGQPELSPTQTQVRSTATVPAVITTRIPPTIVPSATTIPTQPEPTRTSMTQISTSTSNFDANGIANFASFQWQNRIIVVFTTQDDVSELQAKFAAEQDAIIDRHILWFIVKDDAITTNYAGSMRFGLPDALRAQYSQLDADLEVVLIGKDSGVKNRQPFLDSAAIYGQIDTMPMRRAEMTEQAGG